MTDSNVWPYIVIFSSSEVYSISKLSQTLNVKIQLKFVFIIGSHLTDPTSAVVKGVLLLSDLVYMND